MQDIQPEEYAIRRKALMEQMAPGSVAIMPGAGTVRRNGDSDYPFRQNSDFYYLTGFTEPDALLALRPGRDGGATVFFCRDRDPAREQWDGQRAGPEGMVERFGADQGFAIERLDELAPALLDGATRVYYPTGLRPGFDNRLMGWVNALRGRVREGAAPPEEFADLSPLLHEMRLHKSPGEQWAMAEAARITAEAHRHAMQVVRPGLWEYQLEAEYLHQFTTRGARHPAYNCIVAGGDNANTLHYTENSAQLRDGELVLVDAGCEYRHYAADVTRTFPVGGRFNAEQRALYQVVLAAHDAAITQVRPGESFIRPHEASVEVITQGLIDLGLISGSLEAAIEQRSYSAFYMHRVGHWLGLDVHDAGAYQRDGQYRTFHPGMVTTIEPGIYVRAGMEGVEPRWQGIGIRIEDDVLVTEEGHRVLTDAVPASPDEIEALMAAGA